MSPDARLFQALPASPEFWRLFLAHVPACVAVLDCDMRYVAVSERWYRDLELAGRDIIGLSHYQVFPDLDEPRRERHRRCLAGETISLDSDDYFLPSGERLTVLTVKWEYVPWRDAQGAIAGMVMFSEVLTRERTLEEQVAAEADRLHRAEIVSKSGAWEWDVAANVVTWSEGLSVLLGLDDDRAAGERPSWTRLVHPDDRDAVMAQVGRALQGEIPYDFEMRMRRDDGTVLDVRVIAEITRDAQGNPLSVIGAIQDVTELRLAERALQNSERNLLATQQLAHLGSWEWDGISEEMTGSPMMRALYGFPATQGPLGMTEIVERNHPDDRDRVAAEVEALLSGRVPFIRSEFRVVPPSGETVWLQVHTERVTDANGRFIGLRGAVQDITARKAADREIALRDSALQTSVGAVAMAGMDGYFVYGNRAFLDMLGIVDQESLKRVNALDTVRDPEVAQAAFGALVGEPWRWDGELPIKRMDGEHRDILVTASVHRAEGEEPLIIASYMDVTERNAALRNLARGERQLRRAQAMARLGETSYDASTGRYSMPAHTREILGLDEDYASFDAAAGRRLIHPDDWKVIDDSARELIKGRAEKDETTYRFLSPTRGMLHVQTINYVERDEAGRVTGLTGIIQDVTRIKQAEDEAREARRRAERYLDIAGAVIVALDPEARITLINRQGRELLGYPEEELIGRD